MALPLIPQHRSLRSCASHDPYPVLSAGKLYWIQDAYSNSDQFPYSYPHEAGFGDNLNYIRNSVKIVVDMYDGTASFYVMDPRIPSSPSIGGHSPGFPKTWISCRRTSKGTCATRRISSPFKPTSTNLLRFAVLGLRGCSSPSGKAIGPA